MASHTTSRRLALGPTEQRNTHMATFGTGSCPECDTQHTIIRQRLDMIMDCIVVQGFSGSTYSLPISNLYHRGGTPRPSRTVRRALDWAEWAAFDGPATFVRYETR